MIDKNTSLEELAVLVSNALEDANVVATLSGGAAVSIFSDNAYLSADLDFVTSESNKLLEPAVQNIGFTRVNSSRMFEHPDTDWYLEFPPGPLGFGEAYVDPAKLPVLETKFGPLRVITPTLCVVDRLAACWYHGDRQTWDQALEVAKRQQIDWDYVYAWAKNERRSRNDIDKLRTEANSK